MSEPFLKSLEARLQQHAANWKPAETEQEYDRARFGQELAYMAAVCAEFVVWCRAIHGEGMTLEVAEMLESRVKHLREMLG